MRKKKANTTRVLSVVLSLLIVLSVISIPTFKAKAAGTVDDFVERCYTVTLDRGSDPDGFADWKGQLLNGKSVGTNIAYGFLFSAEYKNKNKSDEDYVKDLYMLFMGREADEGGFSDWVGKLKEGKSREEVFAGFANSKEFYNLCEEYGITAGYYAPGFDRNQVNNVNLFVERLYQTCLGRRGDRDGQKDWVSKLLNKQITGIECARSFVQSKEYINKGLSDEDYVENMYKAMMGRASDEGGKNSWLNGLMDGMTRDEVFEGFANSSEFAKICETYKIEKGSYTAKDIGTYYIYQKMIALQDKYPEGMPWTNANTYKGGGCVAFANILSDAAFGVDAPYHTVIRPTYEDIRVGDILRLNDNTHSVIVLKKDSECIEIAEGNYNSSIHWGRIIFRDSLDNGQIDYLISRYPE